MDSLRHTCIWFYHRGMIESPAAFVALLLLLAGLVPVVAGHWKWRWFEVLPPIVISYMATTVLAVAGCWRPTPEIQATQKLLLANLLPALIFLLLVRCDLRAVAALGPRVLLAFACATGSILVGFVTAWLLWRPLLPADGWRVLAAVGAGWVGGTANLVAVSHAVDAPAEALSLALVTDTVCYTAWVILLFGTVPLAPRFNRWMNAPALGDRAEPARTAAVAPAAVAPGHVLVWLGIGLAVGSAAAAVAARLPAEGVLTATSWTLLIATVAGAVAALTPLRRLPGSDPIAAALLAVVVVAMASQGSVAGLTRAPVFVLAGFTVMACHAALMLLAARLLRLDLALCGIASLANIGGIGSAPLLAATYSPALAPVGVLLALLGYFAGTAAGLGLATLLPALGTGGGG